MAKRVLILHTGGTLGMRPREPERTLAPDEFGTTVLHHVPELRELAEIETRVLFNLDSSDIDARHWVTLAEEIAGAVDGFDGVVITHGTDCMAYTASALSYLLRDLPRPVILTGSQRPLADVHTDGRANLVGAVDLATRPIPEVGIYFDGLLLRGNRTTKSSTFAFGAFTSPNALPLAQVGIDVRTLSEALSPQGPFRLEGRFDPCVAVLQLVPGQDASALRALGETGIHALLLIAFGMGNAPVERPDVADAVGELVASGRVVAVASQAPAGGVDLGRYMGGRLLRERGAVGTRDMTVEAATVKLMYLLGTLGGPEGVAEALIRPIAGEISATKPGFAASW